VPSKLYGTGDSALRYALSGAGDMHSPNESVA